MIIDSKVPAQWRAYLLQVGGATLYLAGALLLVQGLANIVVVPAIGSSAFLIFCLPKSTMARPRNMLGGYGVALLVTLAVSPLLFDPMLPALLGNSDAAAIIAALSVGLSILIMAVTDTEHVPAAGTALGFSLQAWSLEAAASVFVMVLVLAAVHQLGRNRLGEPALTKARVVWASLSPSEAVPETCSG